MRFYDQMDTFGPAGDYLFVGTDRQEVGREWCRGGEEARKKAVDLARQTGRPVTITYIIEYDVTHREESENERPS